MMDTHSDDDDIVKVEMQDVYPTSRQQPELHAHNDHSSISSSGRLAMDASRGSHYDHVSNLNDQSPISVEQRAAAIMDRIKQLYFIDDDPARKEFLDDYFDFMRKRDATVTRIPTMAKQPLDLYKLYKTVVSLGGLTEVVRNRHWSKVTRELNLPASITSAAFTLRTQYLRFLYAYECFQKGIDEQAWKIEECDDLSNSSFRATQASPSSFPDNRPCLPSRDLSNSQHHSPQWPNEQLISGPFGPRPTFPHPQAQLNLQHGPPHTGFPHRVEMRCSDMLHRSPKVNHVPTEHIANSRIRPETNNNECPPNCDCGKPVNGAQSPSVPSQVTPPGRRSNDTQSSSTSSRSGNRDLVTSKDSDKSDTVEEPNAHQTRPPDLETSQPTNLHSDIPVCSTSDGSLPGQMVTETTVDVHSDCHVLPGETGKHFCGNSKDENRSNHLLHDHSIHDHNIHEHMSRVHFPVNGPVMPSNMLPYTRGPYCNPRKRPRFYGPNEPTRGGCGCGRGEILESSEPMTFKVHYRTEQRVFVTLQFGKRMYLGELFAEEWE
ncbi:uncharacterized protein LOC135687695 isoform X2 [Rhopilema esculentum]|uniref:uncharacterized protein LOC135687695 isoform X2 n=1 Tax=Rhopilema esculentum TaxID=499914 RepID=UPI0031E17D92